MFSFTRYFLFSLLFAFGAMETMAQSSISSGEIRGTITDSSGAVLSGVQVYVTNAAISFGREVITGESGEYRALLLPPGVYEVRVEREGFASQVQKDVRAVVGETTRLDFQLDVGAVTTLVEVSTALPIVEPQRTQQSNMVGEEYVRSLPIDRRDFLTYTLLMPGVVDSVALADANDYRVVQSKHSGLSFYGSNGRGNSVTVDGAEANDNSGGVRPTLSQEGVQEFQINRSNYSAELGGASGGAINIVSKSGTNDLHGSVYGFFRHHNLDAADPFATNLAAGRLERVKPPSRRQQFGATLGGPIKRDASFVFASFEGLNRKESSAVSVLNDTTIFEPTAEQQAILAQLPEEAAALLRSRLTSSERTREFFRVNSGVFPFSSTDYKFSTRFDQNLSGGDRLTVRYNTSNIDETNPNLGELRGLSRGTVYTGIDHTGALAWTRIVSPTLISEMRGQYNYYGYNYRTNDIYGPEININGFGFFNRDYTLPNRSINRRLEFSNSWTKATGSHIIKFGGQILSRDTLVSAEVFLAGRFTFGALPGSIVSPLLASTTINGLQAFDLGLAQIFQYGAGSPTVSSTDPYYAGYVQDSWRPASGLTLNYGIRYELDDRRDPLPSDANNFAPRFGFGWDPWRNGKTTIRGGYGIFYSPTYYQVDWVVNALNEINGQRQIAQVLTNIQTAGPANSGNVFTTLRNQGVITFPGATRPVSTGDLAQFGITFPHDGPLPPLSVLFRNSDDFVNAYSQQASLGVERQLSPDFTVAANYIFARTLKVVRARDDNLLPAPVNPALGIPVWSTPYFKRPLLLQDNVYESTGRAFYHGLIVEARKRFGRGIGLEANYTLSKATDEVVDFNSDFQANDQLDLRAERALSSFDQRHKLVVFGLFESPFEPGRGALSSALAGVTVSPILRANSARPFNLLVGFDLNGDRHPTTDRPVGAGRNTGIGPDFWTLDLRISKPVRLGERARLEFTAEAFNLFNRLNFQSVNNIVGNIQPPFDLKGRRDLSPSQPLGFISARETRRIQLGARLQF